MKYFYILLTLLALCLACKVVYGEEWTNTGVVNAIYLAEGAEKAVKPFGILSVPCEGYDDCRQICLNTVRNNRKRFADYGYKDYDTYLEFLWHRYAPPESHPLNKFWLSNVLYFLRKYNE